MEPEGRVQPGCIAIRIDLKLESTDVVAPPRWSGSNLMHIGFVGIAELAEQRQGLGKRAIAGCVVARKARVRKLMEVYHFRISGIERPLLGPAPGPAGGGLYRGTLGSADHDRAPPAADRCQRAQPRRSFRKSRGYAPMAFVKQVLLRHARRILLAPENDMIVAERARGAHFLRVAS